MLEANNQMFADYQSISLEGTYTEGATVYVTCKRGYFWSDNTTDIRKQLNCTSSGNWNPIQPMCIG